MYLVSKMKDYREANIDRRTKIIKDDNHLFTKYVMMRKIPYRNCLGMMKYCWVEVSEVLSDTVMEEYTYNRRLDPSTTYGSVLNMLLSKKASENMRGRRFSLKQDNLLNHKLW